MTTLFDIVDTALKIGLGAAIAGGTSYILLVRNQNFEKSNEVVENRRKLSMELALKLETVEAYTNETAFHYHSGDTISAKKALIPATKEIYATAALANLLGKDELVELLAPMSDVIDDLYAELNAENPDENRLDAIQREYGSLKKKVYPYVRDVYNSANA